ncbi:MAG: MscL family protein [bacterium]|nr:MscL family protein [bacterium]
MEHRMSYTIRGFFDFVREQGVVGFAVGFMVGGAATRLVGSLVGDVINPLLGLALGAAGDLSEESLRVGSAVVKWGNLVKTAIDFIIVAAVVYVGVRMLGLDKVDKKKQ